MINKLIENIKKTNAPIVVGLDPMLNYIPHHQDKHRIHSESVLSKGTDGRGGAASENHRAAGLPDRGIHGL